LIIAGFLNLCFGTSTAQIVVSCCGVLIFCGLTAYDLQTLKQLGEELGNKATTDKSTSIAVIGALNLYLDFLNLFLYMLQILGGKK
jgi:FtsH-binding integral membrane protein